MPGLFIAKNHSLILPPPAHPLPTHQVSLIVCQLPSIFSAGEHHPDNKVVTYCPQDCVTVTIRWLKFEPLDQLFLRIIY